MVLYPWDAGKEARVAEGGMAGMTQDSFRQVPVAPTLCHSFSVEGLAIASSWQVFWQIILVVFGS